MAACLCLIACAAQARLAGEDATKVAFVQRPTESIAAALRRRAGHLRDWPLCTCVTDGGADPCCFARRSVPDRYPPSAGSAGCCILGSVVEGSRGDGPWVLALPGNRARQRRRPRYGFDVSQIGTDPGRVHPPVLREIAGRPECERGIGILDYDDLTAPARGRRHLLGPLQLGTVVGVRDVIDTVRQRRGQCNLCDGRSDVLDIAARC